MKSAVLISLLFLSVPGLLSAQEKDKEVVFDIVEEHASFPGGQEKLAEFLNANIKYPAKAKRKNIQGKVFVEFVVWKDGQIKDVKVKRGVHPLLDAEAVRVIKKMPLWIPARQRGENVNARFILPINFRLSE